MSQKEQILSYLLEGNRIHKLKAFHLFGTMLLTQRIADLRREGWEIKSERDPDHNNASVYWIEDYKLNLR